MACATGKACAAYLAPLRKKNWFVYGKPPFARPEAVLAYLARYTHRVAISNSRQFVALDERGVTFRFKDYRRNGQARYRTMTLAPDEFIRRFLLHVLAERVPPHPPLRAARHRRLQGQHIARARELLAAPMPSTATPVQHDDAGATDTVAGAIGCHVPRCGGRMTIVETFERGGTPRGPPSPGCRGPDRHVMTTVTAWFHPPPAGTCRSRRYAAIVRRCPRTADAMPPIGAESHRRVQRQRPILDDRRRSPPSANALARSIPRRKLLPGSNPHSRHTPCPSRRPRVPSSEVFSDAGPTAGG